MTLQISREQIERIRYETHLPELVASMHHIDPDRFRGLGRDRTEVFVRHGWDTAHRLGLLYVNDVAYVLFLMTFLGSHFLEDFRHAGLARILTLRDSEEAPGFDTRIRRAREKFIAFGDRMIGPEGSIYLTSISRFSDRLARTDRLEISVTIDAIRRCYRDAEIVLDETENGELIENGVLVSEARASALSLGLDGDEGAAIALALRWWLGVRFEDDPLYPWVRDVTRRELSSKSRSRVLRDYAIRRLSTLTES